MAQVGMPIFDIGGWNHGQGIAPGVPFLAVGALEPSASAGVVGVLVVLL